VSTSLKRIYVNTIAFHNVTFGRRNEYLFVLTIAIYLYKKVLSFRLAIWHYNPVNHSIGNDHMIW